MATSAQAHEWKCGSRATKVVIPAWVTKLTWESFVTGTAVEITFEPDSQLREFDLSAISACQSLKSICIPASVELIRSWVAADDDYDYPPILVERITFEPGSRLREIQKWSFSVCDSLRAICLPASVEVLDGRAFVFSPLQEIRIEPGNRFFRVSGPFLLDYDGVFIVRYFGSENEVTIPSEIDTLGVCSFSCCSISGVRFDSTSKLRLTENEALSFCGKLQSIAIPSSVEILDCYCFSGCAALQAVSFEADSQLFRIGVRAFDHCRILKSIVLPSSLEVIDECGFFNCQKLEAVIFAKESSLVRIERAAFAHCFSLQSFSLPPLVDFIGEDCFCEASSLSTLTFASPSHVQELLDVPALWTGFKEIPDSVEVLQLCRSRDDRDACALTFGDESRLVEVSTSADPPELRLGGPYQPSVAKFRCFLRVSTRSVKLFRSNLEFDQAE
jgi:hypothetical protein